MSKRTIALFGILFITASSLSGCGKNAKTPAYDPHSALESSIVAQYGFTEYTSLSEAAENVGFSLPLPEFSPSMELRTIRASREYALLEIIYTDTGNLIRIRKGTGTEDVSGNETVYPESYNDFSEGIPVLLKGKENLLNLALWTNNGYSYSIEAARPVEGAVMLDLVRTITGEENADAKVEVPEEGITADEETPSASTEQ